MMKIKINLSAKFSDSYIKLRVVYLFGLPPSTLTCPFFSPRNVPLAVWRTAIYEFQIELPAVPRARRVKMPGRYPGGKRYLRLWRLYRKPVLWKLLFSKMLHADPLRCILTYIKILKGKSFLLNRSKEFLGKLRLTRCDARIKDMNYGPVGF